jgi:hypothetical protein
MERAELALALIESLDGPPDPDVEGGGESRSNVEWCKSTEARSSSLPGTGFSSGCVDCVFLILTRG